MWDSFRLAKIRSDAAANLLLGLLLLSWIGIGAVFALWGYLDFDEALNLQVPASLATAGEYRTTYVAGKLFDPFITTGPTVLFPVAALFWLFGVGIVPARIVMLVYNLGGFRIYEFKASR